jgi:hypothetical protein
MDRGEGMTGEGTHLEADSAEILSLERRTPAAASRDRHLFLLREEFEGVEAGVRA